MSKICIGVKYCGGCNPRYDRTAFLEKIKRLCPEISFSPVGENRDFDAYIIINGCMTACADIKGLEKEKEKIIICCEDAQKAVQKIKKLNFP